MNTQKQITGKIGEDIACQYLEQNGYKIIQRNYWEKWGEIDIICQKKNKTIFVEVKTMRETEKMDLTPEDQMSKSKISKFKKISLSYANHHKIDDWQMDMIAIELNDENNLKNIRYWENVY
ncbi:MAG TPA: YraN family protein [Candidatus Paceibacterota bacterium]|nr:YraN family protein [Candidatus Paceibacterota bacterium]HPT40167.1 YraN family protein [Candidatus Paceibacterota bacterium]